MQPVKRAKRDATASTELHRRKLRECLADGSLLHPTEAKGLWLKTKGTDFFFLVGVLFFVGDLAGTLLKTCLHHSRNRTCFILDEHTKT